MKLAHFLAAAALCSTSVALAQTTPSQTTPSQTSPNTSNPSAVPSGMPPAPSNPKGAVSASEVFTTGSPSNSASERKAMKRSKKDKTKTKM